MTTLEQFEVLHAKERKASKEARAIRNAYCTETDPVIAGRLLDKFVELSDIASIAMGEVMALGGHKFRDVK